MNKQCDDLTKNWLEKNGENSNKSDIQWHSSQTMVFIDNLINSGKVFDSNFLKKIDEIYNFSESKNVEILFRWLMLNLTSKNVSILDKVEKFVEKHGRGVYLRPLYSKLIELSSEGVFKFETVQSFYKKNRKYYHSVIRNTFDEKMK